MHRPWIPALVLLVLLIAFRALGAMFPTELPNFQPLTALLLCSVAFFRGAKAWLIPVAGWVISNPLASMIQGYPPLAPGGGTILAFATVIGIAILALPLLRNSRSPALLMGAGIAAALLFHLVTNTVIWLSDPGYAKSTMGLVQSLWTGRPGDVLPSWVFLRNLAAANVIFTALFLLARRSWSHAGEPVPALAQTR